jgi:hypothetical protein
LPILPGLLGYNEVKGRKVDHAIRFTTDMTARRHVWPAQHDAGPQDGPAYPPMGARIRLRSSWLPDPSTGSGRRGLGPNARLIADLQRIPASAFVAVDTAGMRLAKDSAAVR